MWGGLVWMRWGDWWNAWWEKYKVMKRRSEAQGGFLLTVLTHWNLLLLAFFHWTQYFKLVSVVSAISFKTLSPFMKFVRNPGSMCLLDCWYMFYQKFIFCCLAPSIQLPSKNLLSQGFHSLFMLRKDIDCLFFHPIFSSLGIYSPPVLPPPLLSALQVQEKKFCWEFH